MELKIDLNAIQDLHFLENTDQLMTLITMSK
jgi:hypothetical protein